MWPTRASLISSAWRPHAALLQGWLAGAAADAQQLSQARAYLYELRVEDALVDADDAAELLQLMHRAAYPAASRLESRVSAFLQRDPRGCGLSAGLVARQLRAEPAAGALWTRVALAQPAIAAPLAQQLAALPLEKHMRDAAAIGAALRGDPAGAKAAAQMAEQTARRLAAVPTGEKAEEETGERIAEALVLCAQERLPLRDAALATLRDVLCARTRADVRCAGDIARLATALSTPLDTSSSSSSSSNSNEQDNDVVDAAWTAALCDAAAQTPLSSDAAAALLHAMALAATHAAPRHVGDTAEYADNACDAPTVDDSCADPFAESAVDMHALDARLAAAAPELSADAVLCACAALAVIGPTRLPALCAALRVSLDADRVGDSVGDVRVWRLRGTTQLSPAEAVTLLDAEAAREDVPLNGLAVSRLARCMCAANHFPAALCLRCAQAVAAADKDHRSSALAAVTPDNSAFVLLAVVRGGEDANSAACAALLARVSGGARAFRGAAVLSSPRATAAVLDAMAQWPREDRARLLATGSRLRAAIARSLTATAAAVTASAASSSGAGAAVKLLRRVAAAAPDGSIDDLCGPLIASAARRVDALSAEDAAALCNALVALRSRDALLFRALIARLASLQPDRESIVSAIGAARQLRLVPHVAAAGLTAHIERFDAWGAHEVVLVLSASRPAERARLSALPGAAAGLAADPATLSPRDAFLRASIATSPADAQRVAQALRPIAADDVSLEEVRRALRAAAEDADAVARVCRSGAAALYASDEHELMRLLDAVAEAPRLPNAFFRVVGNAVRRVAGGMTSVNALRWLQLYMKHDVRDDGVGRTLITRARARSTKSTAATDRALREATAFFGRTFTEQKKAKAYTERVDWHGGKPPKD